MKDFILKLFGYSEEYIKCLKSDNNRLINLVVELQGSNTKLRDDLENRYKTLNNLEEENNKLKQYITNLKTKLKNTSFEIDELNSNLQAINIDLDELVTSELDTED